MVTVSGFESGGGRPKRTFGWRAPRSRGALNGVLLILLGLWGGLIPFIGPRFGLAYEAGSPWSVTNGRLWLELVPAAVTVLGGVGLLFSAHRAFGVFWSWVAALAGGWFLIGPAVSRLWNHGEPAMSNPVGPSTAARVLEEIVFFSGLGAVIVFLAAVALGRFTVVGVREMRARAAEPADDASVPGATDSRGVPEQRGNAGATGERPAGDDTTELEKM